VVPIHAPRSVLHQWRDPKSGDDLFIFLGEAQPNLSGHQFAHLLLTEAIKHGADGVITFASVGTQLHPHQTPKAFAVVTQSDMKADLEKAGAAKLEDGQIGGLNGVLLGAAAQRGLPGICLLGEIPYFGGGVANPKAARAVLAGFSNLTGIPVDTAELAKHDESIDRILMDLLERLKQQAEQQGAEIPLPEEPDEPEEGEEPQEVATTRATEPVRPDFATRERIEKLFQEAREDRSRAVHLKHELDGLGIFKQYEDRFLDLFKRAA
jgi:proteasome assembly chaperone (PAC2) family protein